MPPVGRLARKVIFFRKSQVKSWLDFLAKKIKVKFMTLTFFYIEKSQSHDLTFSRFFS